ncbi:MAG: cyclic nucleotide-binding domain-containing protein, partial [Nitrospina sp.]|nr:cyclic nucleotide-binding domain-containing protein [Nitrospina sp.]
MSKKFFKKGEVVIRAGDNNTTCYLVDTGGFHVTKTLSDGTIKKIAQIGPNEIFGEL